MQAHIIEDGIVANTIEVESVETAQSMFPDAVVRDAALGGVIGDSYDEAMDAYARPQQDLDAAKAAAIRKCYPDVDAVTFDAIGYRAEEYKGAEADARAFRDAGYIGAAPASVHCWAINNPTGVEQTDQWAADVIIARADAFQEAKLAMREQRFASQSAMRAATTLAELQTAIDAWDGFIAETRAELGL